MPMRLRICPLSVVVFFGTAAYVTYRIRKQDNNKQDNKSQKTSSSSCRHVVFVLGGPGTGKGTQCQLLQERLGKTSQQKWIHLSAGDLLRAERKKGGELGDLINARIAAGQLVPSEVTCQLLWKALQQTPKTNALIDGFPRSQGNYDAWQTTVLDAYPGAVQVSLVLNLTCPEEVLVGRLLERSKTSGRVDDANLDVIRQRFQTHQRETAPIIELYQKQSQKNLLQTIRADQPIEDVYQSIVATMTQAGLILPADSTK